MHLTNGRLKPVETVQATVPNKLPGKIKTIIHKISRESEEETDRSIMQTRIIQETNEKKT